MVIFVFLVHCEAVKKTPVELLGSRGKETCFLAVVIGSLELEKDEMIVGKLVRDNPLEKGHINHSTNFEHHLIDVSLRSTDSLDPFHGVYYAGRCGFPFPSYD